MSAAKRLNEAAALYEKSVESLESLEEAGWAAADVAWMADYSLRAAVFHALCALAEATRQLGGASSD